MWWPGNNDIDDDENDDDDVDDDDDDCGQVPGEEHVWLRHRLLQLRGPRHGGGHPGPGQEQPGRQEEGTEGVLRCQIVIYDLTISKNRRY